MKRIICEGPNRLSGEFFPQGSKNGALPLLASCIIFDTIIKINNVPDIEDINTMLSILICIGCKCQYVNNSIIIDSRQINNYEIGWELASKMRASFDLLGSLVYRFGKAVIPFPGGCLIGNRKVDMHLWVTKQLGFEVKIDSGNVIVSDFNPKHANEEISFWIPSVGVTKNATFLGLFVSKETKKKIVFHNIAIEPEITNLWDFLIKNGLNLSYDINKRVLQIFPSNPQFDSLINVDNIYDRIEAGTFAIATCTTKGSILIKDNDDPNYSLKIMLSKLWELLSLIGTEIKFDKEYIELKSHKPLSSFEISTDVYPNFPTDLQPQMVSLATSIEGMSVVKENLFDDRFVYVGELLRLGADINVVNNKFAIINGGKILKGAPLKATDIRGGAAILIAALIAQGTSIITNTFQIYRGYEKIVEKLSKLGANIYEEAEKVLEATNIY
ncbi:MAG: UDP-N-acetylglucosamine 1-carboxyvinyltransferase [Candidatus Calescibacterium sp.]|nr:UDP-N-acetylglucosamine 1-carboxyvinyltransferase [Candidatus Calescibacterium sp.]MDW8132326.1 UDP-N-acetylglucosamine 1-carboxyvinyltransferase [Candidatus Calescibacterium sp.]